MTEVTVRIGADIPCNAGVRLVTARVVPGRHAGRVSPETSLSLVLETITRERDAKLVLLATVDARAGVLLGFAAALAALAPEGVNVIVEIGRATAVLGCLSALATFWPREHGSVDVEGLLDFATAELVFTRRSLADAQREIVLELAELLAKKVRRLRLGMILIGGAALAIATGLALQ